MWCSKVLKEIPVGDLKPDETVKATQEAQLLSQLHHPAILRFYTSFLERDAFCIITEFCEVTGFFFLCLGGVKEGLVLVWAVMASFILFGFFLIIVWIELVLFWIVLGLVWIGFGWCISVW